MSQQTRYHIQLKSRRTTITLDTVLSELLAVKLGLSPADDKAHSAVRDWLQEMIVQKMGETMPGNSRLSQWTRQYAIEAIADPKLMNKVTSYWFDKIGEG